MHQLNFMKVGDKITITVTEEDFLTAIKNDPERERTCHCIVAEAINRTVGAGTYVQTCGYSSANLSGKVGRIEWGEEVFRLIKMFDRKRDKIVRALLPITFTATVASE